jgi:CelD/BcsL family acetyltransferase involved in cellulose biosynthesis
MSQTTILSEERAATKAFNSKDLLEVIYSENFEDLAYMQEEWDAFIESAGGEVFLTYDWCRVWWKFYGKNRNLRIFVFRHANELVGLLPVFSETLWLGPTFARIVTMIGTGYTPVCITYPVKRAFLDEVSNKYVTELNRWCKWDMLHIGTICGRYDSVDNLAQTLRKNFGDSHQIQVKTSDFQTYFQIADTWDEQVANLGPENRRSMRRHFNKILKQGVSVDCIAATRDNFAQIFDNFVQMHQSYWQKKGQAGHFEDWPSSYEFHREVALVQLDRQRLRLHEFRLADHCIGYDYAYKFGDTYYWFLNARDGSEKIDFFKTDFAELVKRAIKENVKWFDAMRGVYEYKTNLGGQLFPNSNIYVQPNTMPHLLRIRAFRLLVKLFNILYLKLWRQRIILWLGLKPHKFLDIWLRSHMFSG